MDWMLVHSCGMMVVVVMNSAIENERAGMGCLARVKFGKSMVIRYYSGKLLYVNLYGDKYLDRKYAERVISVSMRELHTYGIHISNDVKDSDGRSHHARIVPAWINPLRFIYDPRSLEGDRTPQIMQYPNRRQAKVIFLQSLFQKSSPDLKRREKMYVRTIRNMEK